MSIIKWQNNPKYDNLSRNFYIFLTASGEGGGVNPSGQPDRFFPVFFLFTSLSFRSKKVGPNDFVVNVNVLQHKNLATSSEETFLYGFESAQLTKRVALVTRSDAGG